MSEWRAWLPETAVFPVTLPSFIQIMDGWNHYKQCPPIVNEKATYLA